MNQPAKVLLIEDNPRLHGQLRSVLESMGLYVCSAENGIEGLLTYNQELPQLVILSQFLPLLSGEEVVSRIREVLSPTQLPILMIVSSRFGALSAAARAHINLVLEKPLQVQAFANAVQQVLQYSQSSALPRPLPGYTGPENFYLSWGDLMQSPLPALLFEFEEQRVTGMLTLSLPQGERSFALSGGHLCYAESRVPDEQLLAHLQRRVGDPTQTARFEQVSAGSSGRAVLQREALLRAGVMGQDTLDPLYRSYIRNIVIRSLFLQQGPFQLIEDQAYVERVGLESMPLLPLLFEGVQHFYTPQALLQALSPYRNQWCDVSPVYSQHVPGLMQKFPSISFAPHRLSSRPVGQLLDEFSSNPQLNAQLLQTLLLARLVTFVSPHETNVPAMMPAPGRPHRPPTGNQPLVNQSLPPTDAGVPPVAQRPQAQRPQVQQAQWSQPQHQATPLPRQSRTTTPLPRQPRPATPPMGASQATSVQQPGGISAGRFPKSTSGTYQSTLPPALAQLPKKGQGTPQQAPPQQAPPTRAGTAPNRPVPLHPGPSAHAAPPSALSHGRMPMPGDPVPTSPTRPQPAVPAPIELTTVVEPDTLSALPDVTPLPNHPNRQQAGMPSSDPAFVKQLDDDFLRVQSTDYFIQLKVDETATDDEVRAKYKEFYKLYHADRFSREPNQDIKTKAQEVLRSVSKASAVLSTAHARKAFEEQRSEKRKNIGNRLVHSQEQFKQGEYFLKRQRFREAIPHFREAIEFNEKDPAYYLRLGWALFRERPNEPKQVLLARTYLEKAVQMNPIFEDAYFYLAFICKEQGKYEQSAALCQRILLLNPGHREAHGLLAELPS